MPRIFSVERNEVIIFQRVPSLFGAWIALWVFAAPCLGDECLERPCAEIAV